MNDNDTNKAYTLLALYGLGVLLGTGQALVTRPTFAYVLGNALLHGGATMAAGLLFIWYPDADILVLFGLAGALGSLGVNWLRYATSQYILTKVGDKPDAAEKND